MRATRVMQSQDSIFRNARQYSQSNEQVFRLMQEGELSQFTSGQGLRKRRRKRQERRASAREVVLKTNAKTIAIMGLKFDAGSIASVQNRLLKHAEKISNARNRVARIRAYRTSI